MDKSAAQTNMNYIRACQDYNQIKPLTGITQLEFLSTQKDDPTITEEEQKWAGQALLHKCSCSVA